MSRCLIGCVLAMSVLSASLAEAQKSKKTSPKQDEQRENQAVKDAKDDVNAAEKSIREREQDLRERLMQLKATQQAKQSAASDLQKVEDRLEAEHAESTGLAAARQRLKTLQADLDAQSKPVLDKLKEQAEYKAAQQALDRAKAAIRPDPDRPDADRQAAVAAHAQAAATVRQLERSALEKIDEIKALLGKVDAAEEAVQAAKKKFDRAVERDGDFKAAKQAFERSRNDEDRAETAVAEAQKKAADARAKLAQARQKLQQKIAADLKDDNKSKNKKKK